MIAVIFIKKYTYTLCREIHGHITGIETLENLAMKVDTSERMVTHQGVGGITDPER